MLKLSSVSDFKFQVSAFLLPLFFPPREFGFVATGRAGGEFKVEESVEEIAMAKHPSCIFGGGFQEARLAGHD